MLTRRHLLILSAAALLAVRLPAHAQGGATAFIQDFGTRLVSVVNGDGSLSDKEQRLLPLIDRAVDIDGIARFCLGRYAAGATPQQMAEYTRLFHGVLVNNITTKIGEYRGVTFRTGTEAVRGDDTVVSTVVTRPNNAPNDVRWVVSNASGSPRIVDVQAEGTSLRLTQRSDYAAFLAAHGNNVGALLDAMRRQVGG